MLSLINLIITLEIKGDFKLCSYDANSPIFDIKDLCEENKTEKNLFTTNNYTLMERSLYVVNGFGYMCHRKRLTVKTVQFFFGGKDKFRNEIIEILNREDCLAMVISRKCQHQDMICNNDQCSSIMEPEIKYAWFNELIFFLFIVICTN